MSFIWGTLLGFGVGRLWKLFKKFGEFLDKENKDKEKI